MEIYILGCIMPVCMCIQPVQLVALQWDDRMPRVSWRSDGQYFVVSGIRPSTGSIHCNYTVRHKKHTKIYQS